MTTNEEIHEMCVSVPLDHLCKLVESATLESFYYQQYQDLTKENNELLAKVAKLEADISTCKANCPKNKLDHMGYIGHCAACECDQPCSFDGECLHCGQQCDNIRAVELNSDSVKEDK